MSGHMAAVIGIFEKQYLSGKPLTVVKPGTQKRDFTHVNDIINGCYLAYKKGKKIHKHLLDDIANNGISIPIDPNHKKNEIKKL